MQPGASWENAPPPQPAPTAEWLRERLREALGQRPLPGGRTGLGPPAWRPLPAVPPAADSSDLHTLMPGFWQDTPVGRVFVVERRFELDHRHGRVALGRALEASPTLWARFGREWVMGEAQ